MALTDITFAKGERKYISDTVQVNSAEIGLQITFEKGGRLWDPFPRTFRAKQIEAIRSRNRRGNKAGRTTSKREGKSPANFAFRGF